MQTTSLAPAAINPNKALWEKGDFTRIAETMRESAEAFVASLQITTDLNVLDIGCGDGNTALPAARRGAWVLGIDIANNLVAAAQRRADDEALYNCRFQQGDAADLKDIEDGSFDLLVSVFGAMFAPRPYEVVKEMVRVTKKGGRIVMANWIPGDATLVAQLLRISAVYTPPPDGFVSPMLWGVEEEVVRRFGQAGIRADHISFSREAYTFNAPLSPKDFVQVFKTSYGPTMNAFAAAETMGKAAHLQQVLESLFAVQNTSSHPNRTVIKANYLRIEVAC